MSSPKIDARHARTLTPLFLVVVLLGLADSMTGSYLVLFGSDSVGLMPFQIGLLSSAIALGGIAASAIFGRRFDRAPRRVYLLISLIAGAVGYALFPQVPSFVVLVVLGLTLVGNSGAAYPQVFALASTVFAAGRGQRVAPILRSGWSFAWAVGPLAGAALLAIFGYTGLFRASAVALLLAAVATLIVPKPRRIDPVDSETGASRGKERLLRQPGVLVATVSMVLVHCAMYAGSIALPLFVTRNLRRPDTDVGLLFTACAVVEVLAALALVWILPRIPVRLMIAVGIGLFAVYFIVTALAGDYIVVLVAQLARGCAIAIVGTAGIQYFQSLGGGTVGSATALFANAITTGSLISGLVGGGLVQWLGTAGALASCGAISVLGGVVFVLGRVRERSG